MGGAEPILYPFPSLTYRKNLDRVLTSFEVDGNFEALDKGFKRCLYNPTASLSTVDILTVENSAEILSAMSGASITSLDFGYLKFRFIDDTDTLHTSEGKLTINDNSGVLDIDYTQYLGSSETPELTDTLNNSFVRLNSFSFKVIEVEYIPFDNDLNHEVLLSSSLVFNPL